MLLKIISDMVDDTNGTIVNDELIDEFFPKMVCNKNGFDAICILSKHEAHH